jgi:sugar phosphate isomerase/epimerase
MRLGGPVFEVSDPESWIKALRQSGYSAAYCPVDESADDATVQAYLRAAKAAGVIIAEGGAWSNPLSPDAETRQKAIA